MKFACGKQKLFSYHYCRSNMTLYLFIIELYDWNNVFLKILNYVNDWLRPSKGKRAAAFFGMIFRFLFALFFSCVEYFYPL